MAKKTSKKTEAKKTTKTAAKKTAKKSTAKKVTKKKATKKASSPSSPLMAFKSLLSKSKQVKADDVVVATTAAAALKTLPHIPTGSLMVDWRIGGNRNKHGIQPCPGIPRGKITRIYGWNSSGKTTLALATAASCIRHGGTVAYLDYENEVDPAYAETLGVPIGDDSKFLLMQPETLEQGFAFISQLSKLGTDLIVVDSVGAGITVETANLSTDQIMKGERGRLGQVAAAWSNQLPALKRVIAKSGTAVIGISQLRQPGPGKNEPVVQGGEAWKFYASVSMKLTRIGYEKEKEYDAARHKVADDVKTGAVVRMHLDKCKVSSNAHRECDFYLSYGKGIDDVHSVFDIAISHKIILQAGSYYSWGDHKIQGKSSALNFLRENPKEFDALYEATMPQFTQDPTLTKDGKELDDRETERLEEDMAKEMDALLSEDDE